MSNANWVNLLPKGFVEALTCGSVFHVNVVLEMMNKRCWAIHVWFLLDEGRGRGQVITITNDSQSEKLSVPEQLELMLMDIDCAPTWRWTDNAPFYDYCGEFAHYRNLKCVKDSGASRFTPII